MEGNAMNSPIRSVRALAVRSIVRISTVMLLASVVFSAMPARANDIVLRWNEIATRTATATNPFTQARVTAIVQLAVCEAVNAVAGEYAPYLKPATAAPAGTSAEAAAIT